MLVVMVGLVSGPTRSAAVGSCSSDWSVVESPNVGTESNFLFAVSATGPSDAWAVGQAGHVRVLAEHWDGQAWTPVDAPSAKDGHMRGVSALTPDDVWAVGARSGPTGQNLTLADHWDGSAWTMVPTVDQEGHGFLFGVAAISAADVWAVGNGGLGVAMAEHWDGTQWRLAHIPLPNAPTSELDGVAAVGPNDVWAVGQATIDTNHARTLIEHWDGSSWKIVRSPNRTGMANTLQGVWAVSANDVWAVGWSGTTQFPQLSLTEHWDGTTWSIIPSPAVPANLLSVAAVSATNVWAAGYLLVGQDVTTVVEHWDGGAWTVVASPNPSPHQNHLQGITALPTGELWAVGSLADSRTHSSTLIESACLPRSTSSARTGRSPSNGTHFAR